jgi:hypothetical protein
MNIRRLWSSVLVTTTCVTDPEAGIISTHETDTVRYVGIYLFRSHSFEAHFPSTIRNFEIDGYRHHQEVHGSLAREGVEEV